MAKIIDLCAIKKPEKRSDEYMVSPDALLTVLKRIKDTDPHGYRNIIKAVCVYGDIPVQHLLKMNREVAK
ncbi:MAG: hypothetical protein RO469_15705 [Thermincola sp.]|nr:hypothetical protein [Thermincola sp.]MDT3702676.1 hypothetical protein [Thermincola sp.]